MIKQFIKFGIVGLSNTVIGYIIYAVTLFILKHFGLVPGIDVYVAQFVMFVLSVAWSFYWNNKYVFKEGLCEKRNVILALLKTYASYAFTSLFLSEMFLMVWVEVCHINEYIAPVLSLLITVPLNFVIQKYWVFRKTSSGRR
ncbi:GtrA family protein [Butyrivibrio sp. VCB2006]|uniref:GtrA family protein n=1 Tax=Butyrivibrio sp. VCB2006 TaxID=1280679 RepID=UPI000492332A|nr:GtrA family protein [Butyrivibrio sp. VCB2006]